MRKQVDAWLQSSKLGIKGIRKIMGTNIFQRFIGFADAGTEKLPTYPT